MRPAEVRFYIDADILGLGKVLAALRSDVTHPGDPGRLLKGRLRPPCLVDDARTKDPDWIPIVANAGWLIITRDRHIQDHRAEITKVIDHKACLVALSAADARDTWTQLETLMCRWRDIEALHGLPGPFIYTATRTSLTKVAI